MPGEGGVTPRSQLEHVEATTGIRPPALDHADLPPAAYEAWSYWNDLTAGRSHNGMAITPLSWVDISAWCAMRGSQLEHVDLELVRVIDSAYVKSANKK